MATKEAAIKSTLTGNAAWVTLVSGGTSLFEDFDDGHGLTTENAVYDANGRLALQAVITFGVSNPSDIPQTTERQFFNIFFYHDSSYALLRQARRKAKDLLNRKRITADNEGTPFIVWVNDGVEFDDPDLGGAAATFSRYSVQFSRK